MTRIDDLFADYASHHTTVGNRSCHFLGIPLIIFSLLGLMARVEVGGFGFDLGLGLMVSAGAAAMVLEWRLGLLLGLACLAFYLGASRLSWQLLAVLQLVGWVLQFLGHSVYEGRSPAFLRNLIHLLVGPLWILEELTGIHARSTRSS